MSLRLVFNQHFASLAHYRHTKQKRAAEGLPVTYRIIDGQGRSRTADTAIFSRVLYQLSYLAAAEKRGKGSKV